MKQDSIKFYVIFAAGLMLIDRLTKYLVMYCMPQYKISSWCSIDLVFNRGISFGLFHSHDVMIFSAVNILIGSVIAMLMGHSYYRFASGQSILGEVAIFTGAMSNVIDRYVYGGVIDFIAFSYQDWHFAVFNGADAFIFCGVIVMLFVEYGRTCKK
jgi:signal peptidase II